MTLSPFIFRVLILVEWLEVLVLVEELVLLSVDCPLDDTVLVLD